MKIEVYRANDITRLSKSTFLTKTYLHDPNFYLEIYQALFWNAKTFYLLQRRCIIVNPLKYCCNNVCPKNLEPPCTLDDDKLFLIILNLYLKGNQPVDETGIELPTSSYLRKRAKFRQSRKTRNETLVKIESDTSNIQSPEDVLFDEIEYDGKSFFFFLLP